MSWTRLRESASSGRFPSPIAPGGEERGNVLGVPWPMRAKFLAHGAFAVGVCSVATVSLVAAPGLCGLFGAGLGFLMLAIAVADAQTFLIPNRLTLSAFLLALAASSAKGVDEIAGDVALTVVRGILLALAFLALREVYYRLRQRDGIGLGDVKLAAVAGAWLDWTLIPAAIEIAAVLALTAYFTNQCLLRQPMRASAKLPFGLFFAPAIWLCWLIGALFLQD